MASQTVRCGVGSRQSRYAAADLDEASVRRATTEEDWALVGALRAAGFSRVPQGVEANTSSVVWVDPSDRVPGTFSLLGFVAGEPVATMRVQDSRCGALELARLVRLDALLLPSEQPVAQFARLSVLKKPGSLNVMFGLFKAAWRWCIAEGLETIVIATPPWSKPIYDFMYFEDRGSKGRFTHQLAGGAEHATMTLPVRRAAEIWRQHGHPLALQFIDAEHPSLAFAMKRSEELAS